MSTTDVCKTPRARAVRDEAHIGDIRQRDAVRSGLGGAAADPARGPAGLDRQLRTDGLAMPPLHQLPPAQLTPRTRIWLIVQRGYLIIAGGLVFWRILELALSAG